MTYTMFCTSIQHLFANLYNNIAFALKVLPEERTVEVAGGDEGVSVINPWTRNRKAVQFTVRTRLAAKQGWAPLNRKQRTEQGRAVPLAEPQMFKIRH